MYGVMRIYNLNILQFSFRHTDLAEISRCKRALVKENRDVLQTYHLKRWHFFCKEVLLCRLSACKLGETLTYNGRQHGIMGKFSFFVCGEMIVCERKHQVWCILTVVDSFLVSMNVFIKRMNFVVCLLFKVRTSELQVPPVTSFQCLSLSSSLHRNAGNSTVDWLAH